MECGAAAFPEPLRARGRVAPPPPRSRRRRLRASSSTPRGSQATGCVVVVPKNSGAEDYASDGANAVLVDATDEAGAIRALAALADDAQRRAALAARGLETVKLYALRPASKTTLEVLCAGLAGLPDRNDSMHRSCSENAFLDFTD